MSGLINKVKDALHSDKSHEQPTGTHGPHETRTANAADPRIDSDRDHRGNPASHPDTHTGTHTGTGAGYSSTGTHGVGTGTTGGYSSGTTEGTHGPHGSKVANAADPRVDSDRDHRGAPGSTTGVGHNTHSTGTGGFGSTGTHSTGTHSTGTGAFGSSGAHSTGTGAGYSSGTTEGAHGPHGSRVANAADPRIDSDRDHRGAPGSTTGVGHNTHSTGTGGYGSTGTHTGTHTGTGSGAGYGTSGTAEGLHGPHGSRTANAADPRVDSDRDHRGTHATTHVGPADNTAGPHKSDMMNKVDPRVDSDLDGSKTVGGDKTHAY